MNERKEAMKASLVQAESGASQTGLRSPEQGIGFSVGPWATCLGTILAGDGVPVVLGKANAARIVQCVNSHDDLVAALERICNYANDVSEDGTPPSFDDWARAVRIARAALLKANGEA